MLYGIYCGNSYYSDVFIVKLVLLPGMDGTGELFNDFLSHYDGDSIIIPLPQSGEQSYQALALYILSKLPDEPHIILAESFSGGLIPLLLKSKQPHIKGLIFVASFISAPKPVFISLALLLPIKFLAKLPGASLIYKSFFLGFSASNKVLNQFKAVLLKVPEAILKQRLRAIRSLSFSDNELSSFSCCYIRAKQDLLVPESKMREINKIFSQCQNYSVDGAHFILQAKAEETALLVSDIVREFVE